MKFSLLTAKYNRPQFFGQKNTVTISGLMRRLAKIVIPDDTSRNCRKTFLRAYLAASRTACATRLTIIDSIDSDIEVRRDPNRTYTHVHARSVLKRWILHFSCLFDGGRTQSSSTTRSRSTCGEKTRILAKTPSRRSSRGPTRRRIGRR